MLKQIPMFLLLFAAMFAKCMSNRFLFLTFLAGGVSFYINENSPSSTPNGSFDHPFLNLSQAYEIIGPTTAELLLQGSSITLNSVLNLTSGTNYTIRFNKILLLLTIQKT